MSKLLFTHFFCLLALLSYGQTSNHQKSKPSDAINAQRYSELNWSTEQNAFSSDDQHTRVQAAFIGQLSNYIVLKNFKFQVPYDASIIGISVHIERSGSGMGQEIVDEEVRLIYNDQLIGRNEAKRVYWSNLDEEITYGGRLNNWNTDLQATDINAASFGVAIAVRMNGDEVLPAAQIDQVEITVHYSTALPVKMLSFNVVPKGINGTQLKWVTASEINNDFFVVERSEDGEQWVQIGQVDGNGNSTEINEYDFFDGTPFNGWNYYRLKQVDFNGAYEYSTVEVAKSHQIQLIQEVYPNPSRGELNISSSTDVINISLFDSMGRLILSAQPNNGELISISLADAAKGVGIVKAEASNGRIEINKFIFQ